MTDNQIDLSTGLTSAELSDVFQNNPRAYMAVRGAVAEKHLQKIIQRMLDAGRIESYRRASGDLDKDFYVNVNGSTISLECKNVEVAKITTKAKQISYLEYLIEQNLIPNNWILNIYEYLELSDISLVKLSGKQLKNIYKNLPQKFRESGLARYQYSAYQIDNPIIGSISDNDFVTQFSSDNLTIDFKRTRNSTDESGNTRRNRFYLEDEIDIVAACLFSRTMEWKFLYAKAESFERHSEFTDRYSDKLVLSPDIWVSDLNSLLG